MTNRSEAFGRLLKAGISSIVNCEGKKAPIVEDELGQVIGVSGDSIQRYKAGHLPPDPRTIEILAEAAIRRGFLGREWLQRFLHAARYPFADKLLDQLCPIGPARARPPHVYHNLPAPTYSQFVMRDQAFADVLDGLRQRSAAVLIVGLGGNGKTSLAREVASACLKEEDGSHFDAAVWVSDKDRPGTTNLSMVLDEIARTLDYPGFTQFEHEEKRREVEQLLKRQRVLIIIDNFETITDGELLSWLLSLPEPSKALITTREYRREFRRSNWPVDLRGMTEDEAINLIAERVRVLKIEKLVGNLSQLEPLLAATGGNPKAIEITMGLMKYERRPLQQVVDDLYIAYGALFDDLFTRAWGLLDDVARRVLLVMTFFPASASSEALSATADVQGFAFDRAVERLTDLALLDVQQENMNSMPRYALHPLVQAFAKSKLEEKVEFEREARTRWVGWYTELAAKVGYCWNDLKRLNLLDSEHETILDAVNWAFQHQFYTETIRIAEDVDYYCLVRGQWVEKQTIRVLAIRAARELGNITTEVRLMVQSIEILSMQGNLTEATTYIERLHELKQLENFPDEVLFEYNHANAFFAMCHGDFPTARQEWEKAFNANKLFLTNHPREVFVRRWIATCLYQEGQIDGAKKLFETTLHDAEQIDHKRSIIFCKAKLADIAINQGDINTAAELLTASSVLAYQHNDRERVALIHRLYARLHTLRGDIPAARAAIAEAIDLFERLGMRRELAEARTALTNLDVREPAEVE